MINNVQAADVLILVSNSFKKKNGKLCGHDYLIINKETGDLKQVNNKKESSSFSEIGDIVNNILNDNNIQNEKKLQVLKAYECINEGFKNKKINFFVKIFFHSIVSTRESEILKADRMIKDANEKLRQFNSATTLKFDTKSKKDILQDKKLTLTREYLSKQEILKNDKIAFIEVNKRPGKGSEDIVIPIGKCDHLRLTEDNLGEIVKIVNESTLNTPYAIEKHSLRYDNKTEVHRPNHNGTHAARQGFGLLEALKNLIAQKGTEEYKGYMKEFIDDPVQKLNLTLAAYFLRAEGTEEYKGYMKEFIDDPVQKLNLTLAAYFLRAGRVDESSEARAKGGLPSDQLHERSALIYEAYAKQLGIETKLIEWKKKLITNATKPSNIFGEDIKKDKKLIFACQLLTTVHELDLVRCHTQDQVKSKMGKTENRLNMFLGKSSGNEENTIRLYAFAKELCDATGCPRLKDEVSNNNTPRNEKLFADCSTQGDVCMANVKKVAIPEWKEGSGSLNSI